MARETISLTKKIPRKYRYVTHFNNFPMAPNATRFSRIFRKFSVRSTPLNQFHFILPEQRTLVYISKNDEGTHDEDDCNDDDAAKTGE
jgi:hypothetical protein